MISRQCPECGQQVRVLVTLPPRKPRVTWPLTPISHFRVERSWAAWALASKKQAHPDRRRDVLRWWRAWHTACVEKWEDVQQP